MVGIMYEINSILGNLIVANLSGEKQTMHIRLAHVERYVNIRRLNISCWYCRTVASSQRVCACNANVTQPEIQPCTQLVNTKQGRMVAKRR